MTLSYDVRSNRVRMTETGSSGTVRETLYEHDLARRLIEAGFDTDGDNDVDEVVGYAYDLGGRRTLLAMTVGNSEALPGDRDVTYSYDTRGQMRTLTDWDDQMSQFRYDAVGRHALTLRANGLRSLYRYDAGGLLRLLRHDAGARLFAQFAYEVDARGNRTEAFEAQRHPGSGTTVIDQSDDAVYYAGDWTIASGFHVTDQPYASFRMTFAGNGNVELTMGEGPDHGLYDVYVGGSLWQSFNGYAASAGEHVIPIPLSNDGPFTLQVNNRADKGSASSGHVMRFKQLSVDAEYTVQTISYTYDAASRVLDADYFPGENSASTPAQTFAYEYDVAGNLTDNNGMARTFNKLNQISSGGVTYDANGNLTNDGANGYTWDRANRLLSMGGHSYKYDGVGNRVSQTVSSIVTQYLLDLQPGLVQVIAATIGADTERYVHSPREIHSIQDAVSDWRFMLQDGLSSVRSEIEADLSVGVSGTYQPYGVPTDIDGTFGQPFRFTGEMLDGNALQYHRARHYSAGLSTWASFDPFEGLMNRAMSLNGYSWVEGNVVNTIDPSGLVCESLSRIQPGGGAFDPWRSTTCNDLERVFYTTARPPTFEEVLQCYNCAITAPLYSREAYQEMLNHALADGMKGVTVERINAAVQTYIPEYDFTGTNQTLVGSWLTQALSLLDANGYVEGWNIGGSAWLAGGQAGREMVYDFATFQRGEFSFSGFGLGTIAQPTGLGAALSHYVGYVAGFVNDESLCDRVNPYFKFENQYSGEFLVGSAAYSLGIGGALGYFRSPSDAPEGLYGQTTAISGGIGFSAGAQQVTYGPTGQYRKSYIGIDGKVKIDELRNDLENGHGSPITTAVGGLVYAGYLNWVRGEVANAAQNLALLYNSSSKAKPCSLC